MSLHCVFQAQLKSTYQDLLSTLDRLSGCIYDNSEMACNLDILNTFDVDTVKDMIQKNKVYFYTLFSMFLIHLELSNTVFEGYMDENKEKFCFSLEWHNIL